MLATLSATLWSDKEELSPQPSHSRWMYTVRGVSEVWELFVLQRDTASAD